MTTSSPLPRCRFRIGVPATPFSSPFPVKPRRQPCFQICSSESSYCLNLEDRMLFQFTVARAVQSTRSTSTSAQLMSTRMRGVRYRNLHLPLLTCAGRPFLISEMCSSSFFLPTDASCSSNVFRVEWIGQVMNSLWRIRGLRV